MGWGCNSVPEAPSPVGPKSPQGRKQLTKWSPVFIENGLLSETSGASPRPDCSLFSRRTKTGLPHKVVQVVYCSRAPKGLKGQVGD